MSILHRTSNNKAAEHLTEGTQGKGKERNVEEWEGMATLGGNGREGTGVQRDFYFRQEMEGFK